MSADRLPRDDDRRLNLEQQKTRAKELRSAVKRGDPTALDRIRRRHPKASGLPDDALQEQFAKLSDAQLVIARELGLPNWPRLKTHIERLGRAHVDVAARGPAPDGDRPTAHMRCGSDIRKRLKEAGFAGDFVEFSDPLWLGPLLGDDGRGGDIAARAQVIAEASGFSPADVEAKLRREYDDLVAAADRYARIVLWCEHDGYDQLCLARVLAEFAARRRLPPVELIAIDRFPMIERFNGLGQLSAAALRLLWDSRTAVTARQVALGAAVWRALCDASPAALGALSAGGTPEMPLMAPALRRHLQELPWTGDGLSLTQRLALQALRAGPRTVSQLFWTTQAETEPMAFMGDLFFWAVLRDLLRAPAPPAALDPDTAALRWPQQRLSLTATGEALLAGTQDWMRLGPPERWVGNVRVASGGPVWRWSEVGSRPVLA